MTKLILAFMLMFSVSIFAQKKVTNHIVDAGCGMCMFKQKNDKGCAMAVKIDNKIYYVEGIDKKKFGDAHADDGFCKMVKKAEVSGEIKKGKFYASSFKYVEEPKNK